MSTSNIIKDHGVDQCCVAPAMIADRVVLLPGTTVGKHTVMGTGALGKRDTTYQDGSVWIGSGAVPPYRKSLHKLTVLL